MTRALLAALLALPVAASAQYSDEGEYWAAKAQEEARRALEASKAEREAAVRAAAAAAKQSAPAKPQGACAENPGLDGPTGFSFSIDGKAGIAMSFIFSRCELKGANAVRTYDADQMGYSLTLETAAGASKSSLAVIERWPGRSDKTAAALGARDNAALLAEAGLSLGAVTLSDTRGDAKTSYKGQASLKAGKFSGWGGDSELKGCQ